MDGNAKRVVAAGTYTVRMKSNPMHPEMPHLERCHYLGHTHHPRYRLCMAGAVPEKGPNHGLPEITGGTFLYLDPEDVPAPHESCDSDRLTAAVHFEEAVWVHERDDHVHEFRTVTSGALAATLLPGPEIDTWPAGTYVMCTRALGAGQDCCGDHYVCLKARHANWVLEWEPDSARSWMPGSAPAPMPFGVGPVPPNLAKFFTVLPAECISVQRLRKQDNWLLAVLLQQQQQQQCFALATFDQPVTMYHWLTSFHFQFFDPQGALIATLRPVGAESR